MKTTVGSLSARRLVRMTTMGKRWSWKMTRKLNNPRQVSYYLKSLSIDSDRLQPSRKSNSYLPRDYYVRLIQFWYLSSNSGKGTDLPMEVTDDVLSVLFQQYVYPVISISSLLTFSERYQGFLSAHVAQAQQPNAQGQKVKMAQVVYDSPELASVAKEALDGFTLKKGWNMTVAFI